MMRFEGRPLDDSDPLFAPLIALDRKRGTAFWRPSAKWKKAGYKGGAVRLSGVLGDGLDAMRAGECRSHTRLMLTSLGHEGENPHETGTWAWLIYRYQTDRHSPIHDVKANTRQDYHESCAYWMKAIGATRIEDMDYEEARNIKRGMEEKGRSVAFVHRKFTMLRALAKYGCVQKDAQVRKASRQARDYLSDLKVRTPAARSVTPSKAQTLAVVAEADKAGYYAYGTGLLIQWTFALRGNDVFGNWMEDKGTGGIRKTVLGKKTGEAVREERWQDGLTRDMFAHDLSGFTKVVSKTSKSLPEPLFFSLEHAPELKSRIRQIIDDGKVGPLLLNSDGLPYTRRWRAGLFRRFAKKAGIPDTVRMMDTRAGAITDGKNHGLGVETMRDAAGHLSSATTERYMRGRSETIAKVVKIRNART